MSCQHCSHQHPHLLTSWPLAWCSHQLTQSLPPSEHLFSSSELEKHSDKNKLPFHTINWSFSKAWQVWIFDSFFTSLLFKMAIPNPLHSSETYNLNLWLMQTSFFFFIYHLCLIPLYPCSKFLWPDFLEFQLCISICLESSSPDCTLPSPQLNSLKYPLPIKFWFLRK